jgi:Sap-like sulfolipid-1-addressing protein
VKEAIGQVLSLGLGVALSPAPIIAVVLMLATPRGRVNGPAFVGGWIVGRGVRRHRLKLVGDGVAAL